MNERISCNAPFTLGTPRSGLAILKTAVAAARKAQLTSEIINPGTKPGVKVMSRYPTCDVFMASVMVIVESSIQGLAAWNPLLL